MAIVVLDDGTVTSLKWNPTQKQYSLFLAREVELARLNIQRVSDRFRSARAEDFLCSTRTFFTASDRTDNSEVAAAAE